MYALAVTLHLLATVVWVGGMFFAHMALRPAVNQLLEPPQRLSLLRAILGGFFPWVWVAVVVLLITGFWIFLGLWGGHAGLYVHIMMTLGLVMMGIFIYIYSQPFKRMKQALEVGDIPAAGAAMAKVRVLIATNLILGLLTTAIAGAKAF